MFDKFVRFLGYKPVGEAYMCAIRTLLQPLEKGWQEAVLATIEAAQRGLDLNAAGKALAEALEGWKAQVEQENEFKIRESKSRAAQLADQVTTLEKALADHQNQIAGLLVLVENRDETIQELSLKVRDQNLVIAEQYYKLSSIFGDADHSHASYQ